MAVRVAVDALGGDRAPDEVVAGALDAASDAIQPVLFGPAGLDAAGLDHVVSDEAIVAMDDKPAEAVRGEARLVARARRAARSGDGEADAVVSAGNTGAVLAARCSTSDGSRVSTVPGSRSSSRPSAARRC